jgi:hypothetical protein
VNSHTEILSNIVSKVKDLVQRLDLLSADNESLKHRVLSLKNNVKIIEQTNSNPLGNNIIGNNLINEMIDRQEKKKYFIFQLY